MSVNKYINYVLEGDFAEVYNGILVLNFFRSISIGSNILGGLQITERSELTSTSIVLSVTV